MVTIDESCPRRLSAFGRMLMKLNEILNVLGIEALPDGAIQIFNSPEFDASGTKYLDEEYMRDISQRYNYFCEYEDKAICNAQKIKEDTALLAMLNLAVEYFTQVDGDYEKIFAFPMPQKAQNTDALNMFSAVLLMTQIEASEKRYRKLGFSADEARETVLAYGSCFVRSVERTDVIGMMELYRTWLYIYVAALIVKVSGYNFEVRKFSYKGVYLKNKNTAELKVLIYNEKVHRDGYILGSAGYADDDGSYYAAFEETNQAFLGYTVDEEAVVINQKQYFPKSEWEILLKPGDDVIALHIPKGADMSSENLDRIFMDGVGRIKECYPDRNIKCMTCGSWLLSPQLKKIIRPDSKIIAFGDRFVRFPMKDAGMAVFSFVFIGKFPSYNDLPENTSLERALKKVYLDGEYIYSYPGAFEI